MMAVAPMSTARFASATLMMPLRQNCLPHFFRTSAASCQFIDWSSIVLRGAPRAMGAGSGFFLRGASATVEDVTFILRGLADRHCLQHSRAQEAGGGQYHPDLSED